MIKLRIIVEPTWLFLKSVNKKNKKIKSLRFFFSRFVIYGGKMFGTFCPTSQTVAGKRFPPLKSSWNSLSRGLKYKSWNLRRTTRQLNEECKQKYDKNKKPPVFPNFEGGKWSGQILQIFIEGAKCYTWLESSWNSLFRGLKNKT